jgi:prefoldin subunit 5
LEDKSDLQILEEELYGINAAVSKINERMEIVNKTESTLNTIQTILTNTKNIALESYDSKYNTITENILHLKEIAQKIPYKELNDFNKEEIIPQGAISYNFNSINYDSLIMSLPKSPPISKEELNGFIQEIESKYSNILLQISQLKSYRQKLEMIKDKLSVTAIACYLSS